MENQHQHIKGYRDLTADEISLMNNVKELAAKVGDLVQELQEANFASTSDQVPDKRWVAIAQTHLQQGFMALTRSIAKPTTF
ncbi:MAG: hypothetical protein AB7U43_12995 [Desulfobacter sp.]